jgi:hypothetical protein
MDQTALRSPSLTAGVRRALWAAALVYLGGVALVVLWPSPVDRPAAGDISAAFRWLHAHGLPRWLGYAQLEWTSNVAFFVPFGLLAVLLGFRLPSAVLGGVAASVLAETSQALFLPERTASLLDVLANGLGALVGSMLGIIVLRRLSLRRPEPASGSGPGAS